MKFIFALSIIFSSAFIFSVASAAPCKNGAFETFAQAQQTCGQAITACENAAGVSDPKTGRTGYCPGEWKDGAGGNATTGMGLWADCIAPLAKGQNPALGGVAVNPTLTAAAKQCQQSRKPYCAQNPTLKWCAGH